LLGDADFVETATLKEYGLYCVTPYYPGVVPMAGEYVRGEVYEVDTNGLKRLDSLEDEGRLYTRVVGDCVLADGTQKKVVVYSWLGTVNEKDYVPCGFTPWHPGVLDEVRRETSS
jgi:gamma-glutamylcyclotransferase (GGCT)/AIG2-like uncharacterized protein YtfP